MPYDPWDITFSLKIHLQCRFDALHQDLVVKKMIVGPIRIFSGHPDVLIIHNK